MRTIRIPYGRGSQQLHIDEERLSAVIAPRHLNAEKRDQAAIVKEALQHPIESPRLSEVARGKRHVLVITSDHTRPVPSRITLPALLAEIRSGNPQAEITILVASGMHREMTQEEQLERFGEEIAARERIVVHRAADDGEMAYFGVLPSGGELWLNRLAAEADLVVAEGFIEPHFFAGFSGGRKAILPGIASRRTVMYNHNARFIRDPRARQGILEGNSIHADMAYAAQRAGLAFILNVLVDGNKRIVEAVAGDPVLAHREGCRRCEAACRAEPVVSDIAITSNGGYPLDQNLYQSVKGMTAAERCVRPGGAIILCAALGDGHGGEAFFRWFSERDGPEAVARDIEGVPPEKTTPDQWQAQILARVMCRARCWFVTGESDRSLVEDMHMRWAPDVDTALAEASALLGQQASVTVIPDGEGVIL